MSFSRKYNLLENIMIKLLKKKNKFITRININNINNINELNTMEPTDKIVHISQDISNQDTPKKAYIFTEIVNCAKIGKIALDSFHKYHDQKVHVYGNLSDFEKISYANNNVLIDIKTLPFDLNELYRNGHLGTATLWAYLMQTIPLEYTHILHFDSDDIFRSNIVDEVLELINNYDLIGPIRNYKNNPHKESKFEKYNDVVATNLFAFCRDKIKKHSFDELVKMCRGMYNPYNHPVIDFFDPVSFEILYNGGKIYFLDHDDVGGTGPDGSRNNCYAEFNNENTPYKIDFGKKLVHFSSVGSGMFYFNNPNKISVPEGYVKYALDRYALFCKIFYNEDIGIDVSKYVNILGIEKWF